jgi:transcriptional regulator with XRE-family HTH domain
METLGDRIKRLRVLAKISQSKLARDACFSRTALRRIEANLYTNPKFDMVRNLALALEVSLDYLGDMPPFKDPGEELESAIANWSEQPLTKKRRIIDVGKYEEYYE